MNCTIIISSIVSSVAAVGIFVVSFLNYKIYISAKENKESQENKFNDLLEALIISTILSGPSSTGQFNNAKAKFLEEYIGDTVIFKN